jgi:hypothetical protein
MIKITYQDGKVVFREGQVGTERSCCCEDGPCDIFVNIAWEGVQVGLNQCAKCANYPGDLASTIAGTNSLRNTIAEIMESRGFTVRYSSELNCMPIIIENFDGIPSCPACDIFPCNVEWCNENFGGLCLDCDGTVETDLTLDPLPTEFFNTDPDPCGIQYVNEAYATIGFTRGDADFLICNSASSN